jgi:hypothetical protein
MVGKAGLEPAISSFRTRRYSRYRTITVHISASAVANASDAGVSASANAAVTVDGLSQLLSLLRRLAPVFNRPAPHLIDATPVERLPKSSGQRFD